MASVIQQKNKISLVIAWMDGGGEIVRCYILGMDICVPTPARAQ
jgi:hypothetical protein